MVGRGLVVNRARASTDDDAEQLPSGQGKELLGTVLGVLMLDATHQNRPGRTSRDVNDANLTMKPPASRRSAWTTAPTAKYGLAASLGHKLPDVIGWRDGRHRTPPLPRI